MRDRSCLSYWFPKLQAAGVPVPRTEIVRTTVDLLPICDGNLPDGWGGFLAELKTAIAKLTDNASPTPPVFLRTGQGSGKHDWSRCCYVDFAAGSTLPNHVAALVEWSHMVDFFGLPHDVWCVREMLPTAPLATLGRYGGMPLVTEVRCFVGGGRIVCAHPYWPERSILEGLEPEQPKTHELPPGNVIDPLSWLQGDRHSTADRRKAHDLFEATKLSTTAVRIVEDLAMQVARAFADDGAWSVDLLETTRGWVVTDMAEAHRSFHWPDCVLAKAGAK